jgi:hypothetical protein
MKRAVLFLPLLACVLPTRADEQKSILPRDGTFYVEAKPVLQFRATLNENWACPNVGEGTLYVFAPVLPELAGQRKVSTRLLVEGNDKLKAEEVVEEGIGKRPMLRLRIDSNELSPKSGIHLRLEYRGTLYARTLKLGKSPKAVPELMEYERRQYLATSVTMDYNDPDTFFGSTDGKHIAFHIDTGLEPDKRFHPAWAQFLLLKWSSQGKFFRKERQFDSKWDVKLWPLTKH